jgi:hypothetical protein
MLGKFVSFLGELGDVLLCLDDEGFGCISAIFLTSKRKSIGIYKYFLGKSRILSSIMISEGILPSK